MQIIDAETIAVSKAAILRIAALLLLLLAIQVPAICAEQTSAFSNNRPGAPLPEYQLQVAFDLESNLVRGTASILLPVPGSLVISCGSLKIISVSIDGKPLVYELRKNAFRVEGGKNVVIKYEGVFRGESGGTKDFDNPGLSGSNMASGKGIILTGAWYPAIEGLAWYRLTAVVPSDFEAVSEADEITARELPAGKEVTFVFPHPLPSLDLIAGRYRVAKESIEGIDIYTYFFPDDAGLSRTYLDHAKKYLALYPRLLVPYPYKRFSIVENILPTGLSMPTFTLIGREVLRLPFIPSTSLGHEITHQWFGNYVYADFSKGNWLEAVTSYLSDHLYREQEGKGWEYRKNILVDFQSYVTPEKDFPLRKFRVRTDAASMAIGYGKGAMLFHMLEMRLGKEKFLASLRTLIRNNEFKEAAWADVEASFEHESAADLHSFFSEWLDRTGVPSLAVLYPGSRELDGIPYAAFTLVQQNEPYHLAVPVVVYSGKDETRRVLSLQTGTSSFRVESNTTPTRFALDSDYDVMRMLAPGEFPPVIARLAGDHSRIVVYPEREKETYAGLIELCRERGFAVKEESAVTDRDIETSSLLVVGADSPVWKRLFGKSSALSSGFFLSVRNNPLASRHVVAAAAGKSKEEVDIAAPKIFHYGTYSLLRFEQGENVTQETAQTDRGMVFTIRESVPAVRPDRSPALREIIEAVKNEQVILIGERHENYEDHKVELAVIKGLYEQGRKFAIGMEMFQYQFQPVMDAYSSKKIGERELLKKTEYFKRWAFDYNLYREIIEFARAKGIPLVALNQKTEIMDTVAKGGLDALSSQERKEIPQDMDMADQVYKRRLKDVYEDHPAGTSFENFYQSQILWDETMAHSAARFIEEHPDYQLVVMAGEEHVMYGSGIPSRIERLTGKKYSTLVNGTFDRDVGTYVLFPEPLDPPFTPKLGLMLEETGGRARVTGFADDSPARAAGIEKGDVVQLVSGWQISSVNDIKIALFDKEPGEVVTVWVKRKTLFVTREIAYKVRL